MCVCVCVCVCVFSDPHRAARVVCAGVLYFLSSTVNPILYHLLSRKFRQAFKRTFCRCCLHLHSLPPFYKLKAKFAGRDSARTNAHRKRRPSERCNHFHLDNDAGASSKFSASLEERVGAAGSGWRLKTLGHQSTKESYFKVSVNRQASCSTFVSSGTHAHSDGRLLAICRHKNCSCRRTNLARCRRGRGVGGAGLCDSQVDTRRAVMSYPDVIPLRYGGGDLRVHCCDNTHSEGDEDRVREVCVL